MTTDPIRGELEAAVRYVIEAAEGAVLSNEDRTVALRIATETATREARRAETQMLEAHWRLKQMATIKQQVAGVFGEDLEGPNNVTARALFLAADIVAAVYHGTAFDDGGSGRPLEPVPTMPTWHDASG